MWSVWPFRMWIARTKSVWELRPNEFHPVGGYAGFGNITSDDKNRVLSAQGFVKKSVKFSLWTKRYNPSTVVHGGHIQLFFTSREYPKASPTANIRGIIRPHSSLPQMMLPSRYVASLHVIIVTPIDVNAGWNHFRPPSIPLPWIKPTATKRENDYVITAWIARTLIVKRS